MNYVAFFAVLIPLEIVVVVTTIYLVRRRTMPDQPNSWLHLLGVVVVLLILLNLFAVLPMIGIVAIVIWLVALKRLTGLDVLGTALLSASLGVFLFAATMVLAKFFQVPLPGR